MFGNIKPAIFSAESLKNEQNNEKLKTQNQLKSIEPTLKGQFINLGDVLKEINNV